MQVVHSWLNEDEKREARGLGARLQRGEAEALRILELRLLRATKDNEHFTEWFSEVVECIMSEEARATLQSELPAPPPEPPRYHRPRA